jgi:hypothetical protein
MFNIPLYLKLKIKKVQLYQQKSNKSIILSWQYLDFLKLNLRL